MNFYKPKLIAGLLVFLFFFSPLAMVYAEEPIVEEGQGQTVENEEQIIEEQTIEQDAPEQNTGSGNDQPIDNYAEEPKYEPDKSPRRQTAQPDEISGALVYEYPISIAEGRNGMTPRVSLVYNSQSNEKDSFIGQGWSLTIPYIERVNRKGLDTMYTDNYFNSYVDGELVNVSGNEYRAKVDNGNFLKYVFENNSWTITDKEGRVYTYGLTNNSRQDDPNNSEHVYKWMIEKEVDLNGNEITYGYFKETNQIYIDNINYTNNVNSPGKFVVSFVRGQRPYSNSSYKTGFLVTTSKRLEEINFYDTTINDWQKHYVLNYVTGDNTRTSILSSITESGRDDNGVVAALAPTIFEYEKSSNTDHWSLDENYEAPIVVNSYYGRLMSDVNGDGYEDILRGYQSSNNQITKTTHLSNGSGEWNEDLNYAPPQIFAWTITGGQSGDAGPRFADVNGDGLTDLLYASNSEIESYLNTGNGWQQANQWRSPASFNANPNIPDDLPGALLANINGDGLVDIIRTNKSGSENQTYAYINNGNGWSYVSAWQSPGVINPREGWMMADVNGDGLDDILQSYRLHSPADADQVIKKTYLNNGQGQWILDPSYEPPVEFMYHDSGSGEYFDHGIRFVDVNGDGLNDLLASSWSHGISSYINTGNGWLEDSKWNSPFYFTEHYPYQWSTSPAFLSSFNGDSQTDIFRTTQQWNGQEYYVETTAYKNKEKKSNILKKITYPTGGWSDISYTSTPLYKNGNALLNPDLPTVLDTVSAIIENDGNGVVSTNNYSYEGGLLYYNGPFDNKFAGFSKITKTDLDSRTIFYYHQGNDSNIGQGEYDDHWSKIGKKYREEIWDLSWNLQSKNINTWDKYELSNGRYFVRLTDTISSVYDSNSSHKDRAESYGYDVANGNRIEVTQWGEVIGQDNGVFADTGNDKYLNTFVFAYSPSSSVIGLPAYELIRDQANNKVQETIYYYDNLGFGQIDKGNRTKDQFWVSGDSYIDVEKTYNNFGLVISEKDPNDNVTTYIYDSYNLYPSSVTNALNQTTSYEYDYSLGKPKGVIDPNGRSFYTDYDGLDRVIFERQPDIDNPSISAVKTAYEYVDTPNAVRVKQTDYLDTNNAIENYTYFDGLGRKIQERSEAETNNQFNVRDFIYTQGDLLLKESLPYESTGSAKTAATTNNNLYTTYTYDALKRVVAALTVVGTTTNNYDDWKTTVTDAKGKIKDLYRDAYDNLVRVDEHNGASTYSTYYEWNYAKKLKKITDALGNIRNFNYDGLARVLSAEDLHAPYDATFGVWNYSYDNTSNLIEKIDPNGTNVTYTYDALNRVLAEEATDDDTPEVVYEYDNCAEGIGRLCVIANSAVIISKNYNALGNIIFERKRIGRAYFDSTYTYDRQGNQLTILNPDGSQVKYSYNNAGSVNKIERKEAIDPNFTEVVSSINYNAVNLPTVINYANGVVTTNTYDINELYRLRNKTTVANNENIQDLTYTYDPVGNITQIVDASTTETAKTTDYTYDDLHRLLSATITNSVAENVDGPDNLNQVQTFTYDAIGNILSKSDVGTYSYDGNQGNSYANPHAVTSAGGQVYEYDRNGNLVHQDSLTIPNQRNYTWDYNNRLLTVKTENSVSNYNYDAGGQRIKTIDNSGTTLFITKEYTVEPAAEEKHIFFGDTAVATVRNNGLATEVYNIHADHLTGSNVITSATQAVDELTDYYAFGTMRIDQQNGQHNEKRKFTGHEYDEDTGLTYANARYYDASLGRWLSQDNVSLAIANAKEVEQITNASYLLHLSDPQALNSYSYVKNNPLKYKDVTGEYWETVIDLVFLGISLYDFNRNPSFTNGLFVGLDVAGVALPIPAVAGYIKNAVRVERIANYFLKVARNGDDVIRLSRLFADNVLFNFSKRAWSAGEAGNDVANLVGHFFKHGDDLNIKSVREYYNTANNIIDSSSKNVFHFKDFKGEMNHYDKARNLLVVVNKNNEIKTMHQVDDALRRRNLQRNIPN